MTRSAASHDSVIETRGEVGIGPIIAKDLFVDTPGTNFNAHTPDTDPVGNGWVISGWGSGFIIGPTGDKGCVGDWPNHGRILIDCGDYDRFDLRATLNIGASDVNYVGLHFSATGTIAVGNFSGYSYYYRAGTNTLGLSYQYPGCPGTIDSEVIALDETGQTEYLFRVVKNNAIIQCYLDDDLKFAVENSTFAGRCHGFDAWTGRSGTVSDFQFRGYPTPARVSVSPSRSNYGQWFEDNFVEDTYPKNISLHTPDYSFLGMAWEEENYSGTSDAWQIVNYQGGAVRRNTDGFGQDLYYLITETDQADCVIRSRMQDHRGINPMWDGILYRYIEKDSGFYRVGFNAESNLIRVYRVPNAAGFFSNLMGSTSQVVNPSDAIDIVITLNGNSHSIWMNNITQDWTDTISFSDGTYMGTKHGVYNRPQNGYNPWSFLYFMSMIVRRILNDLNSLQPRKNNRY